MLDNKFRNSNHSFYSVKKKLNFLNFLIKFNNCSSIIFTLTLVNSLYRYKLQQSQRETSQSL